MDKNGIYLGGAHKQNALFFPKKRTHTPNV